MEIVTGVFDSDRQAVNAVVQLRNAGLTEQQIGYVTPVRRSETGTTRIPVTDTEDSGMGKAMGAAVGGAMGAAGGATLGLAAAMLVVPGVGPVLAFGLLGAALLGGTGAAVGAQVGDAIEEGLGEGVPHEDVYIYEDALKHGRSVVVAHTDDASQASKTREVMNTAGSTDIDELRENWWRELRDQEWTHYQANGRDFESDELSYRKGFEAALHPGRRGKSYSEVEKDLRATFRDSDLDSAFRRGYERGSAHHANLMETRRG
ncbi:MAG TPA: hypothetical protein VGQ39_04755 [Pyrinomonadaceae bacterium]|nr:hypothetical protein [Pyrinomonadaceae bacterium]